MREFRTKVVVNAPAHVVFRVITNSDNYPRFDNNCKNIEGSIEEGNLLKIKSKKVPHRERTIKVVRLEPHESMIWFSSWPLNLLKSTRTFSVIAKDDFTTEFHMVETISGPLLTLFPNLACDKSEEFSLFSKGLKRFIESRP